MGQRVAEHVIRGRLFGTKRLLRVDLHGISAFGAGDERSLIRWEWIESIAVERGSVFVRGAEDSIVLPGGAYGLGAGPLAEELEKARDITYRSDVIRRLSAGADTDNSDDAGDDGDEDDG